MVSFAVEFDKLCAEFFTNNLESNSHSLEMVAVEFHFSIFGNKDQVRVKYKNTMSLVSGFA